MIMFSQKLLKLSVDRALGHPTETRDELFEELYEIYINDSNSSTLREHITAEVAGCDPIPGKLGRDAKHKLTLEEKEVKPKNYTGKATNGGGCFNDYTRARYNKDLAANLPIIASLFVNGRLVYAVEFKFEDVAAVLDAQITEKCETQSNRYVRSASWTYQDWIDSPNLTIHHLDKEFLQQNQIKGEFKVTGPFYKKLMGL